MAEDARDLSTTANTNPIVTTKIRNIPLDPENPTTAQPRVTPNDYAATQQASLSEAVKTIHVEDFKKVHLQPCVRNAFLYGIAAGFAFGGLKLVLRAPVPNAANWAAGTFAGTSVVTYEVCQYRRQKEKAGMQRAVEIIDRRKAEREKAIVEKREAAKRAAEEKAAKEEAERLESLKPWYKKLF
ncbi:hypothetical protein L873DRAFT_1768110 [Choiromyces venosus 120613-1]|uniref:Cytochrome c oxidase assembly protein COX20, mitochondrial n=1 Tax=Choiromyces venosus 120613-1 TaxID=1336337 RepID=A0A3N4JQD7_9PEZI|nr:hypothetical protein L873DRAFT_1768110 [Choiromyces venosus 120613-1]